MVPISISQNKKLILQNLTIISELCSLIIGVWGLGSSLTVSRVWWWGYPRHHYLQQTRTPPQIPWPPPLCKPHPPGYGRQAAPCCDTQHTLACRPGTHDECYTKADNIYHLMSRRGLIFRFPQCPCPIITLHHTTFLPATVQN